MVPDTTVLHVRALIIAADLAPIIVEAIRARLTHLMIVEATTPTALDIAVRDGHYHAVCLQYPLSWTSTPAVITVLAQWLPTCPILVFSPENQHTIPYHLTTMMAKSLSASTAQDHSPS